MRSAAEMNKSKQKIAQLLRQWNSGKKSETQILMALAAMAYAEESMVITAPRTLELFGTILKTVALDRIK